MTIIIVQHEAMVVLLVPDWLEVALHNIKCLRHVYFHLPFTDQIMSLTQAV